MNDMDPKQQNIPPAIYVLAGIVYGIVGVSVFLCSLGLKKPPDEKYKNHWNAPPW